MKTTLEKYEMTAWDWRLILGAVVVANAAMVVLLWLGAPNWLAVPVPTFGVAIAGVLIEYRRQRARKEKER